MSEQTKSSAAPRFEALLLRWQAVVQRFALLILLLAFAAATASVYYITHNLGVNTDTTDMLSAELPWRKTYSELKRAFPKLSDNIAVVVDGATPDHAQDASQRLAERLRQETQLFEQVFQLENTPFFRNNRLLYLDVEELEDLADQLSEVQPFLSRLSSDPSLRGLFSLLTEAIDEKAEDQDLELGQGLRRISRVLRAHAQHKRLPLSWQEMMSGKQFTVEDKRSIFLVKPKLDFNQLLPGEEAVLAIRAIAKELELTPRQGVRVRLTGGSALDYEEMQSAMGGAQMAGLIALVLVTVVMSVGLRSLWLLLATLLTLILGLIYTAAFATFAVGELNLISIAFAVLYIGLGVDFSIHYCLRYKELLNHGNKAQALRTTSAHVGGALALCTVTTAIGFFAFIPTAYAGVAELGIISGGGIFISLFVSLTVLPALLSLVPIRTTPPAKRETFRHPVLTWPVNHAGLITGLALLLAVLSALILPRASFDHNPIHLMDPATESVQTFKDLLRQSSRSPMSISIVVPDAEAAEQLSARLEQLPSVDSTVSIADFIPDLQEDKLAIIEDMTFTLGSEIVSAPDTAAPSLKAQLKSMQVLYAALRHYLERYPNDQEVTQLRDSLQSYFNRLRNTEPSKVLGLIKILHVDLVSLLPGRLKMLEGVLEATEVTGKELPPELVERWVAADGRQRLEVLPRDNLDDNAALQTFVDQVRTLVGDAATDSPVVNVEAGKAVVEAFQQAFVSALIIITLLLIGLLKRKLDALIILAPLLLAGLLTGATTVLLNVPFNFANIIALPLLLGIGVDSAVHILHRYRTALPEDGLVLRTSTARAVVLSALTTSCGFGNLAFSSHTGTASMGIMLTAGIIYTLICTLLFLPALLAFFSKQGTQISAAQLAESNRS